MVRVLLLSILYQRTHQPVYVFAPVEAPRHTSIW